MSDNEYEEDMDSFSNTNDNDSNETDILRENIKSKKEIIDKRKQKMSSSSEDKSEDEDEDEDDADEDFNDALKKYYRLKNEYEESLNDNKKKIMNSSGLSLKEKRIEFNKLKRKCVNCKRPVGTIFNTKFSNDETSDIIKKDRHLIALCGDRDDPCPLNIDINLGATDDIRNIVIKYEKELNEFKNKIIIDKNELLFGYITSNIAVEKFEEIKEEIKSTTELFDLYFENLNDIIDNPVKKADLETLEKGFYENVDSLKSMVQEFERSGDTQYVLDAVELYKNEILVKVNKIMKMKYAYTDVDYNEDEKTYHLYQLKHTIKQFEIDVGENDHAIISMKIGMPQKIKKTSAIKENPIVDMNQERIPSLKKRPKLVIKESTQPLESEPLESEPLESEPLKSEQKTEIDSEKSQDSEDIEEYKIGD
jgi:hypothetical protein